MNVNYAPRALQGVAPQGREEPYDIPLDVVLTANQNLVTSLDADPDAYFLWRALVISQATGIFSVRFSDSRNYFLSSARIASANLSSDPSSPYPIFPELPVPPNGKIIVDLLDTSGAGNTIQLVFRGAKRYSL